MPGPVTGLPEAAPGDRDDPATWDAATAVTALYSAHWRPLVRLAALLTGDASVAEEIVQDAFVALYRRWGKLGDPAAALGYVRVAVVNGSRSRVRHRIVEERNRQPAAPDPAGPEEVAVRASEDARVLAALRTLPPRQQEVLVLRYYGDLSEAEIAATIGISRGSVKRHAFRGMAGLRERLAAGGTR
jgi:RNA polymerase sigma-70 factor (sigma-E family)